jgi:hypothetical protein
MHLVAGVQLAADDRRAVDERAVLGLEVLQHPVAVAESQLRVPPRNAEVVEDDVAAEVATDERRVRSPSRPAGSIT